MKKIIKNSLDGWRPRNLLSGHAFLMLGFAILVGTMNGNPLWVTPMNSVVSLVFVLVLSILGIVALDYLYSFLIGFLFYLKRDR